MPSDWKKRLRRLSWRVDEEATKQALATDPSSDSRPPDGGGLVVYVDDSGQRRRLPADLDELSTEERDAAIAAMSRALRGPLPGDARLAAIERLTEIRAAGRISEEDFERERRRLEGLG